MSNSVPFDTTELNALSGTFFEGTADLYFTLTVQSNENLVGESKRFEINERGASITVDALDSNS